MYKREKKMNLGGSGQSNSGDPAPMPICSPGFNFQLGDSRWFSLCEVRVRGSPEEQINSDISVVFRMWQP